MTHRHTDIPASAVQEIENALGLDKVKEIAQAYANGYDADCGDTIREYVDRAAYDLYPSVLSTKNGERANFKGLVRHYIRERQQGQLRRAT
jgi:hypothetical protein